MAEARAARTAAATIARRSGRYSLYDVLQVSPRADLAVLQAAYRALARAYHPDVSTDPAAEEQMRELNEAYKQLSDPRRRAVYDLTLNQRRADDLARTDEAGKVWRRTGCWQCSEPLQGDFGRYCAACHWVKCESCKSCGCSHPTWRRQQPGARLQRRVLAWLGWGLSGLLGLGWLATLVLRACA